jgi:hypothetical protein
MRRSNISLTLALAASTALGTWTMAQNRPTTQPVPGGPMSPQPREQRPAPPAPTQTPRPGGPAAPATQPGAQSSLPGESAKDAALPKEKHELHVALRHITIARDVLKETRDGGDQRVAAKTDLNLAIDQLQKALGVPNTISDKDQDNTPAATPEQKQARVSALTGESEKDKALPKENHELHVALRHATIGRDVLKVSKDGAENRTEAIEQTEDAMARIQKVLGLPVVKNVDRDNKTPSAKTE